MSLSNLYFVHDTIVLKECGLRGGQDFTPDKITNQVSAESYFAYDLKLRENM